MIEFTGPLTLILVGNSLLTITLIFNQNENSKDSIFNQNLRIISNPLENFTWVCFFLELILLLLKTRITDF
jgi:hypothetical protein